MRSGEAGFWINFLVLLAVLVPLIGWIGACWSVVLAETVHATLLTLAARREAS